MQIKKAIPIAGLTLIALGTIDVSKAHSESITISNPSFEQPSLADGSYTIENIPGWSTINTGNPGVFNPPSASFGSIPDGENTLYSNGGTVIQTLPTTLTPNTTYNLGVSVGKRLDYTNFPGFTVELRAGNTVLVSANQTNILSPAPGTFQRLNLTYISPSSVPPGQHLEIRLKSAGAQTNFDLVTLDASQPGTDVDRRVDSYLLQAGLPTISQLGEERWFNACDIRAQQGAGTFNSGNTPPPCVYQPDLPGWQIVEYEIDVLENKYGRGSYTGSIIAAGGGFIYDAKQTGDKWKLAIDRAIKAGDIEVKLKLDLEYQRQQQLAGMYASNKNTFFLSATANGGLFRNSVIHVKGRVKMIRIW